MLIWARWLIVVCSVLLVLPCRADYLPKGAPEAAGARNIILVYNGSPSHRNWEMPDFVPLLSHVTAATGTPRALMFDTALVLPLQARSGNRFCPGFGDLPANKADFEDYVNNSLFGGANHLRKMDDAAQVVCDALFAPGLRWKVILTIPYPDPAQRQFGSIVPGGRVLDFASNDDRLAAVKWYISWVWYKFHAAKYKHLDLVGLYWVHEATETMDKTLLPLVGKEVRKPGMKFFWIPWYKAPGSSLWATYGFDTAIHQPNYFFRDMAETRLSDAAAYARQYGMGVEIELDDRALNDAAYREKYRAYLRYGQTEGYQEGALTAWYAGGDTLVKAAWSTNPDQRAIYDETYNFIVGKGVPGDVNRNRVVDLNDVRTMLRMNSGLSNSVSPFFPVTTDVDADRKVSLVDAVKTLRHVHGLQPSLP